jgi:hypothetical protein
MLALTVGLVLAVFAAGCSDDSGGDGNRLDAEGGLDAGPVDGSELGDVAPDTDGGPADTDGTSGDIATDTEGDAADADGSTGDAGQDGGGGQPPCRSDKACPGNAVCDEGDCRFYRFVQISDVTPEESSSSGEACGEDAAGADLFQLELRGPFDRVLGYGKTIESAVTSEANNDAQGVFDGVANSLYERDDGALCPSGGFGPNTTLSLGCDGVVVVMFTDGAGNIINLATGQQLVIHEFGNQCCEGGCPEEYWEVRVCKSAQRNSLPEGERDDEGNFPSCATRVLSTGSGQDQITVQLPRD